jgi:hypothetical protein
MGFRCLVRDQEVGSRSVNVVKTREQLAVPRIENCLTEGVQSANLCTTCVQECGFKGPEIGPKQRRINNRLLSYRLNPAGDSICGKAARTSPRNVLISSLGRRRLVELKKV